MAVVVYFKSHDLLVLITRELHHYTTNFTKGTFVVRSNFLLSLESALDSPCWQRSLHSAAEFNYYVLSPINLQRGFSIKKSARRYITYIRMLVKNKGDINGYLLLRCKLLFPNRLLPPKRYFSSWRNLRIISAIVSSLECILRCGKKNLLQYLWNKSKY